MDYRTAWNNLVERMEGNGWTATVVQKEIQEVEKAISTLEELDQEEVDLRSCGYPV